MRYVKRNRAGQIIDTFAIWEEGCDRTPLRDDDPELVKYLESVNVCFVKRDAAGVVVGVFSCTQPDAAECIPLSHPDVVKFLAGPTPQPSIEDQLKALSARVSALEAERDDKPPR